MGPVGFKKRLLEMAISLGVILIVALFRIIAETCILIEEISPL